MTELGKRSIWLELATFQRISGKAFPDGPWLSEEAKEMFEEIFQPTSRLLEHGAGGSTIWFAQHCGQVISFESDEAWTLATREELIRRQLADKAAVMFMEQATPKEQIPLGELGMFDIVFVDGDKYGRTPFALAARDHVSPGGYMVVDDTRKPSRTFQMEPIYEALDDWPHQDFCGIKDNEKGGVGRACTTFWRRPS